MSVSCLLKTIDPHEIADLPSTDQDTVICPKASTCTWCGTNMMWDDHCKTREQAAQCHRYKGSKKKQRACKQGIAH